MIIISETPKMDVLIAIDREAATVSGLRDTLDLLQQGDPDNMKLAEATIQKNAVLKGIENELKRTLSPSMTLLGGIDDALNQLNLWLPKLRDRIAKSPTKIYDKHTISFREKGILDTVSSINFWTRYAAMVLDVVIDQSTKAQELSKLLTKVDLAFFTDTAKYFSHMTIKFCDSIKNLEGMIENLSEETYDEVSEQIIESQLGKGTTSVLSNLGPHQLNPLHWWKYGKMKKDVSRIQSNIETIQMLAMKIARLNNRNQGTANPDLDRQIETYQNAIIKKRAENLSIEARYNG